MVLAGGSKDGRHTCNFNVNCNSGVYRPLKIKKISHTPGLLTGEGEVGASLNKHYPINPWVTVTSISEVGYLAYLLESYGGQYISGESICHRGYSGEWLTHLVYQRAPVRPSGRKCKH